jgi:epoxyqueuosine reductase
MGPLNTLRTIYSVLENNGFVGRIVSIKHLKTLKEEIQTPHNKGTIDDVFYNERLVNFNFTIPDSSPEIKSIIITSAPQPLQKVSFEYQEKRYNLTVPPTYSYKTDKIIENLITSVIKPKGYRLYSARLPLKLLAVHSGLARYGKNNITYVDNTGSFNRLEAFYSDIPVDKDNWGTCKILEHCENCSVCIKKCPTGAITPDRFILKAERCITFHNERLNNFPEWIENSWHNCLIGCMICQSACPANKKVRSWIEDSESFNDEETGLILNGDRQKLTYIIEKKLEKLDLLEDFDLIPRNLSVLITGWQHKDLN